MEENNKTILAVEAEVDASTELYAQETTMVEAVEEISVEPVSEMTIDVTETTGVVTGTGEITKHTHEIDDIANLLSKLNRLGSAEDTVYSQYSGYAEFRRWYPNEKNAEVGRFVSLVYHHENDPITDGNTYIKVCEYIFMNFIKKLSYQNIISIRNYCYRN
jgi:hypothetical protein